MDPEKLCSGHAKALLPFANEVLEYEFEEKPDYAKLKFLLVKILLSYDV